MAISAAPDAFQSEFRHPEMVQSLHGLLNLALEGAIFARVASVLQSSGWGKSRTICELHRQGLWVVYCTFTQGSGYPCRSAIADWFLGRANALITADTQGQLLCAAFFLAYMEACLLELLSIASSTNPRDFVRMLYRSGEKCEEGAQGVAFWHNVEKRVDGLLNDYAAEGLDNSTEETRQACWTDWELRAGKRVNGVVARLHKLLSNEAKLKVLFVFDEASILLVPEALEKDMLLPLRLATSAFNRSAGILALFADTTPILASFCAAPIRLDKSDRMPGTSLMLAPPIWACFWADHGLADEEEWRRLCSEHGIVPEDVLSRYWPVRYGRPLWWATFKAGLTYGAKAALDNVVLLARDKLLGGHGGWAKYLRPRRRVSVPHAAALAILASRCALQMDPNCSMVLELVAGHLMTVVKVNECRECVWASFPMEPIVAAAASDIMQDLDRQKRSWEVYMPLSVALKAGWVHKGYNGELLARLIMLRAFDKAVQGKGRSWCTVDELVRALVGKSLLQLGREQEQKQKLNNNDSVEESLVTKELKQLAQARLCFNAFYKIGKRSYDVTAADLRMVAERRCAVVADENTMSGVVDHFYVDENAEVVMHQQVKAEQADYGLADMAKESPAFCGLPDTSRGPYLDLHMNVENVGGDKVTLVDAKRVESAVLEQKGKWKVLTAVLESQCDGDEAEPGPKRARDAAWKKQRDKNPRMFKAWQDWLAMPRANQVILKVNGLEAVRPLLGNELFGLLADTMEHGPLLDPVQEFEASQAASVSRMFLREFKTS